MFWYASSTDFTTRFSGTSVMSVSSTTCMWEPVEYMRFTSSNVEQQTGPARRISRNTTVSSIPHIMIINLPLFPMIIKQSLQGSDGACVLLLLIVSAWIEQMGWSISQINFHGEPDWPWALTGTAYTCPWLVPTMTPAVLRRLQSNPNKWL